MEVTMELLVKRMLSLTGKTEGFLIDGFPRSLEQGVTFQSTVRDPDTIVFLDVSDEVMRSRALNRKEGRSDDNEETINKRLEVFHSQTEPVINSELFKQKVIKVNSEGSMDETAEMCSRAINNALKEINIS